MAKNSLAEVERPRPVTLDVPVKSNMKIKVIAIVGLAVIVLVLVGVKGLQFFSMIKVAKTMVPPPESVTSAKVQAANWEATQTAIGTLVALRGVTLASEVTGRVRQISFDSGTSVKKGAVLVKLDTSFEEAQLESARAEATLAKLTLNRTRTLRGREAATTADLESAEARAKESSANVASLEATIAKKTIRAPFDGRIAIRQVELGQILSSGTPIASLQSVSPIYAEFSLPQQALAELKLGQKVRLRNDIFPGSSWEGEVSVINPEVDVATRNVRIRATFQNPDGRLAPGMFVNVDVISGKKRSVTFIPTTSVIFAPYGDSVFVIEEKSDPSGKPALLARQRFVRLGDRQGDYTAVISGLSPGETVVSNGAFKLRNGMPLTVNNALAPATELSPKPTDN